MKRRMITYSCPACVKVYTTFGDLNTHRIAVHGRDAHGNLVRDSRTPRLTAALAAEIAALRDENDRMRAALIRWHRSADTPDWTDADEALADLAEELSEASAIADSR